MKSEQRRIFRKLLQTDKKNMGQTTAGITFRMAFCSRRMHTTQRNMDYTWRNYLRHQNNDCILQKAHFTYYLELQYLWFNGIFLVWTNKRVEISTTNKHYCPILNAVVVDSQKVSSPQDQSGKYSTSLPHAHNLSVSTVANHKSNKKNCFAFGRRCFLLTWLLNYYYKLTTI